MRERKKGEGSNTKAPTLKDRVLRNIAFNISVPRNVLLVMDKNEKVMYRLLNELESEGYIRTRNVLVTIRGSVHSRTYYVIAKAGIEYLSSECADIYPCVADYISSTRFRPSITGRVTVTANMRNRIVKMATASVLMYEAGITAAPIAVGSDPDLDGSWMAHLLQQWKPDKNAPRFYNSREVKTVRAGVGVKTVKDGSTDRYVGILLGTHNRALVYSPLNEGLGWKSGRVASEMQTLHSFCGILGAKQNGANGIILVPNAREFRRLYDDEQELRGTDVKNRLGRGADHLWVVPVRSCGVEQLRHIAHDNLCSMESVVLRSAVEGKLLLENNDGDRSLFPLRDESGRLFAYGVDLDIRKMQQLQYYQQREPTTELGIICHRWQTIYYNQIFNHCRYLILD